MLRNYHCLAHPNFASCRRRADPTKTSASPRRQRRSWAYDRYCFGRGRGAFRSQNISANTHTSSCRDSVAGVNALSGCIGNHSPVVRCRWSSLRGRADAYATTPHLRQQDWVAWTRSAVSRCAYCRICGWLLLTYYRGCQHQHCKIRQRANKYCSHWHSP